MKFLLSPYDAPLDLLKNEDCKLYLEATKGLKEGNHFSGKKTEFAQFSKLMGKAFKEVRVMETLMIPTEWDTTNTDTALQRFPTDERLLNLFDDSKVTKKQVRAKSELVWSTTDYATTTKYFGKLDPTITDDDSLNKARNQAKIKHVIMGKKIWSSLTAEFQIEIMGKEDEFTIKGSDDYDGPMLWDFIKRRVKPSTKWEHQGSRKTSRAKHLPHSETTLLNTTLGSRIRDGPSSRKKERGTTSTPVCYLRRTRRRRTRNFKSQ